jgi:hypothetical protein
LINNFCFLIVKYDSDQTKSEQDEIDRLRDLFWKSKSDAKTESSDDSAKAGLSAATALLAASQSDSTTRPPLISDSTTEDDTKKHTGLGDKAKDALSAFASLFNRDRDRDRDQDSSSDRDNQKQKGDDNKSTNILPKTDHYNDTNYDPYVNDKQRPSIIFDSSQDRPTLSHRPLYIGDDYDKDRQDTDALQSSLAAAAALIAGAADYDKNDDNNYPNRDSIDNDRQKVRDDDDRLLFFQPTKTKVNITEADHLNKIANLKGIVQDIGLINPMNQYYDDDKGSILPISDYNDTLSPDQIPSLLATIPDKQLKGVSNLVSMILQITNNKPTLLFPSVNGGTSGDLTTDSDNDAGRDDSSFYSPPYTDIDIVDLVSTKNNSSDSQRVTSTLATSEILLNLKSICRDVINMNETASIYSHDLKGIQIIEILFVVIIEMLQLKNLSNLQTTINDQQQITKTNTKMFF